MTSTLMANSELMGMDDHGSEVRRRCDDSLDVGISSKGTTLSAHMQSIVSCGISGAKMATQGVTWSS